MGRENVDMLARWGRLFVGGLDGISATGSNRMLFTWQSPPSS